jgi:hypothetical protein
LRQVFGEAGGRASGHPVTNYMITVGLGEGKGE